MAEEKEQQEQEEKKQKGLSIGAIIAIAVGVLIVQAGIIYVIFQVVLGRANNAEAEKQQEEKPVATVVEPSEEDTGLQEIRTRKIGKLIPVGEEDIIANPRSQLPEPRYVVLRVLLEVDPEAEINEEKLDEIIAVSRDEINRIVRSHWDYEFQNPGFEDTLKNEIIKRVQPYFGEVRIYSVRFTKLIVQ